MNSWDLNEFPVLKSIVISLKRDQRRTRTYNFSDTLFNKMKKYDITEHGDIKKLILKGYISPCFATKAKAQSIEQLPLEEKVYFWYHRGELKEKLEEEYSDGWDLKSCPQFLTIIEKDKDTNMPFVESLLEELKSWSVKDEVNKPFQKIIENKDESREIRYLLLKKMAPCYLKDFIGLKEVIKDGMWGDSLDYMAIERIISLTADDFPVLLELLKDENVQQKTTDKSLAKKIEVWNADENKEMVEFVLEEENDSTAMIVRKIIINQINEKSIEKLPLKEKIYLWNYRGELRDKINEDFINNLSQEDVKELNKIIEKEGEGSYIYNIFKKWAKEIYSDSPIRSPF